MKKSTLFYLSALCALPSLAVALPIAGDMAIDETLTAPDVVTVLEAGTMTASNAQAEFQFMTSSKSGEPKIATFDTDYTFDLPTLVTVNASSDASAIIPVLTFAEGTTVKFNNFKYAYNENGISGKRFGLIFSATKLNIADDNKKPHVYVNVAQGGVNPFYTTATKTTQELFIRNVNFHASVAGNYGHMHIGFNASFYVEASVVEMDKLSIRQPLDTVSRTSADSATGNDKNKSFAGKLFLNGNSVKCTGVMVYSSSKPVETYTDVYASDVLIDFGENNVAQYFAVKYIQADKASEGKYSNNWDYNRLYLTNFGANDMFIFTSNPFTTKINDSFEEGVATTTTVVEALSRMLVLNDEYINNEERLSGMIKQLTAEDLAAAGITDQSFVGKWALTIPEPSTYAMILGALALGFVVYRRRK